MLGVAEVGGRGAGAAARQRQRHSGKRSRNDAKNKRQDK